MDRSLRLRAALGLTLTAALLVGCQPSVSRSEPDTDPTPTRTTIDYDRFGAPRPLTHGYLGRSSPDGSALFVEAVDPVLSKPGCEGQPEPIMFRVPTDGAARQPVLVGGATIRGDVVRGPVGLVAVVKACEELVSDVWVGTEAADGTLRDLTPVPLDQEQGALAGFGWSADGTHLLAGRNDPTQATPAVVVAIDPATGATTDLFPLDGLEAKAVTRVVELIDGTFVVAGYGEVVLRDATGASLARAKGVGFAVGSGASFAVYGDGMIVLVGGIPHTIVHHKDGIVLGTAAFSPNGEAVVYTAGPTGVEAVVVTDLADAGTTVIGPPGRYLRAIFTGDRAIACNRQTDPDADPGADPEVIVVPVGG